MSTNLDTLKDEVERYLAEQGFNVFFGHSRLLDSLPIIYWDCERFPDFRKIWASREAPKRSWWCFILASSRVTSSTMRSIVWRPRAWLRTSRVLWNAD